MRAKRLALTTWTRLGRCNSTRQACFQPGLSLRRRGSSARSCARARARRRGRRRVLWEVRARRRPAARVVWAIPPTSCMPHRAAATCGAGLCLAARGDGVPRARRRVDTASAEATGLALAVHRPGGLVNARAPRVAEASHVRGGSCPRARVERPAPCVRVVSVRGHRPLLSTVQTTPCASRGAGRRACWPPPRAAAPRRPRARAKLCMRKSRARAEPGEPPHDTHHASHPPTINRI